MSSLAEEGAREILFSWDSTGSMYPCLSQVRRNVEDTVRRLFEGAANVRVGLLAHGDYCDGARMISTHELSTNQASLCRWVKEVEATSGGDAPEAYEQALHRARSFNWTGGHSKALVMIGDEVPHTTDYYGNTEHIDWRKEAAALRDLGVKIYAVQCLNRRHADSFYSSLASITGGVHLRLDQFSNVPNLLLAVGYQQQSEQRLADFEAQVIADRQMNRDLDGIFNSLRGRTTSATVSGRHATRYVAADLQAVPPGRFQVLPVDHDQPIQSFVTSQGVTFKKGRGFYELTKSETIQGTKEIVLMSRESGDLFTGQKARELLGLPLEDEDVRFKPVKLETWVVFCQSTSANRRLKAGTRLLYEVPDWG